MSQIHFVHSLKSSSRKTMRDVSHEDFVVRWANFVKNNPDKWRVIHSDFINSQLLNSRAFLKKISLQKNGAKKIIELYSIKDVDGYKNLLRL